MRLLGRPSPIGSRSEFGKVCTVWLGCAAVCFANPYFHRLSLSWVEIYQMSSLPTIIKEHSRLDPADWTGLTVIGFAALYCALLLTVPARAVRVVWLLPVVWFALACMRVRHAPLFAVVALVGIADLFPHTRIAAALVRRKSDLFLPRTGTAGEAAAREAARPFLLPAAVVLVAVFLQAVGAGIPVLGRGWARLDPGIWPVELLPELKAHENDRPGGTCIFNEYAYGGFLIHQAPAYRVFIDDRCELFGDEFLVRFVTTRWRLSVGDYDDPTAPIAAWQAEYAPFDVALVETDGGFDVAFSRDPAWRIVRRTETATLYRKAPAGAR